MKPLERPKSLTELVTETLREWIVSGKLDLGEHLSEVRVSRELQVSRTPVREAMNRLEMEGLLNVEPQRGTFVFCLAPEEVAKLCDARVCLETTALREAVRNDPGRLFVRLTQCTSRMTAARNDHRDSDYLALDTEFHQHFFDCSGNRFLDDAYQAIAQKMASIRNRLGRHPDHMAKSYREHLEITEAVGRQDIEAALRILRLHIDRKEGSYWKVATDEPA
ncbi:GntR family transcriptional regulator [Hoeflea sp.]|uniref:GntR family transcriptional regulator n=1 Tax=Hoeflea sp. TaxID=1940281 RepID=UPI0019BA7762|nr:GntR family transcriptional regulator [Hoeflea sp.]MBC7280810.1 GntR family transcriptional regulator [Hoeflea sp.]